MFVRADNALAASTVPRLFPSGQLLSFYSRRHVVWCHRLCRIFLGQYVAFTSVCVL